MKKSDIQTAKVQAKYIFTPTELVELGRCAGANQRHRDEMDAQLSSIKSDYKGKIESAESLRDVAFRKLNDGYEMREVEAVIEFNEPKKGQKTLFLFDDDKPGNKGQIIRCEPMTQSDLQRELDLLEKEKDAK